MKNTVEIPFTFILSQYPGEEIKPNNRLMTVCEPSELGDLILKINKDPIGYLCSNAARAPGMIYGHMAKHLLLEQIFSHKGDLQLLMGGKNNVYVSTSFKLQSELIENISDEGFLVNRSGVIQPGDFISALKDLPRFFTIANDLLRVLWQHHASTEMLLDDCKRYTVFSDSIKGYAYYAPWRMTGDSRERPPAPAILNYICDLVLDVEFGKGNPNTFEGSFIRLTARRLGYSSDKHSVVITDLFRRNQNPEAGILTTFGGNYGIEPRIDVVTTLPEETR